RSSIAVCAKRGGRCDRRPQTVSRLTAPAAAAADTSPFICARTTVRTAFIVGVLLGLTGILAAARYVPWFSPPRLASLTSVVANGGRAEEFVIRLPADRISAHGDEALGLRGGVFPAKAALPQS